jgi:hypothetical protein
MKGQSINFCPCLVWLLNSEAISAGSRLPLPDGYLLMEITHPTPPPPTTTPAPSGVKSNHPLDPIPEEDEAQAEQGSSPKAATEAADTADDSAALSVGCALLLQLGLEETSALDNFDDASTGAAFAKVLRCFLYCHVISLRREQSRCCFQPDQVFKV